MDVTKANNLKANDRLSRRSLLFGVLVWFADLNIVYALSSVACKWRWFPFRIAGIPGLPFVEGAITMVSLLLMVYLIYLPWRNWRALQSQKRKNPRALADTERSRESLMAFVAMLLNGFFFLFMIAFFVPLLALNACVIS